MTFLGFMHASKQVNVIGVGVGIYICVCVCMCVQHF